MFQWYLCLSSLSDLFVHGQELESWQLWSEEDESKKVPLFTREPSPATAPDARRRSVAKNWKRNWDRRMVLWKAAMWGKNPQQWPQSMNNLQFVFAHVCTLNSILDKETHIGCIIAAQDFEIQHLLQQLHVVNSQVENSQQAAADLRDELDFRGKELLEAIMLKRCGKNTKRYEEFALNMRVFLLNCDTLEGRFVRRTMFAYSESVVESCRWVHRYEFTVKSFLLTCDS